MDFSVATGFYGDLAAALPQQADTLTLVVTALYPSATPVGEFSGSPAPPTVLSVAANGTANSVPRTAVHPIVTSAFL